MQPTPETRIGEIAARHPLATRVFSRYGIDFCCGGGVPLRQACERRGLHTDALLAEIREVVDGSESESRDWTTLPIQDLIDHIVTAYHRPLREELPRLEAMAQKVAKVHAERDPEGRLPEILRVLGDLQGELLDHLEREESSLFPRLAAQDAAPVETFLDDHQETAAALSRLRELTEGYVPPADACNTWRALWASLEDLEHATHQHISLENNILFPRAAAGPHGGA